MLLFRKKTFEYNKKPYSSLRSETNNQEVLSNFISLLEKFIERKII